MRSDRFLSLQSGSSKWQVRFAGALLAFLGASSESTAAEGVKELAVLKPAGQINALVIAPDEMKLASGSADGTIRLWDLGGRKEAATIKEAHKGPVSCLAFSADSKLLASGCSDRKVERLVRVWDVATAKEKAALAGKRVYEVYSVQFSPDGTTLAAGLGDFTTGGVNLWDLKSDKEKASFG